MGLLDDLLAGAQGMGTGSTGDARTDARPRMPAGAGAGGTSILMALLPVVLSMLANRGGGAPAPGTGGGGSGGLGDILGQMLGGAQRGGSSGDIFGGAGSGGGLGGLGTLLESLQRAGYGDQARSWIGTGANSPISPEAIEHVFGSGGLAEIARQTGISEAETSQGLSQLLPEVVDRVTPNGDVPDLDSLVASVDQMSRRYGLN
jgi:uncharacterized protein YidB (DUF937 family)